MLLGDEWSLAVYPGGDETAEEGLVSLDLYNMSDKAIEVDVCFGVIDGNGKQVAYKRGPFIFDPEEGDDSVWGFADFAKRSDLLSSLINGALVIEVRMKLATPTNSVPLPFIPENPVAKIIQDSFMDENYSDILFKVGGEEDEDNAMIHAHRIIVANSSTILSDLCESHNDGTTPIQINDVTPDVFRLMLSYTYGGKISNDDMKSQAREIIYAADKYGVVNLKLEAEACFVGAMTFTLENVMEQLLYADSMSLALLKEAAMDYMMENRDEVLEKLSFTDVPGTLVRDVLAATARREKKLGVSGGGDGANNSRFNYMCISELRRESHEKGLNVDGSREMLITALKAVHEAEVGSEENSEESDEDPEEE
jgi:hypothetical protein